MDSSYAMTEGVDSKPSEKPAERAWSSPELENIYREYSHDIYYLTLRMLRDPTQAEDATHDVFLKCYRNLHKFRGDSKLKTWLYRIAVNHCRNLIQSWHQRTMVNNVDEAVWNRATSQAASPSRALETKELGARIQEALDQIPEEYKLLLLLVANDKLSYDEIAHLTDQTTDSVRGKLHRARKAFSNKFKRETEP